jgi:hypothetical protein
MDYEELATVLATALEQGRYERDDLYLFDTQLAWEMTNQAHVRDPQRTMVWQAQARRNPYAKRLKQITIPLDLPTIHYFKAADGMEASA